MRAIRVGHAFVEVRKAPCPVLTVRQPGHAFDMLVSVAREGGQPS